MWESLKRAYERPGKDREMRFATKKPTRGLQQGLVGLQMRYEGSPG
jgi:hypothetical protein